MQISEAQKLVDSWIKEHGVRYFSELTNMAMLTEEVGEVARIIARRYGDQSEKESDRGKDLGEELADVMFVLICLANQTGIDLEEALNASLQKKTLRHHDIATITTKVAIGQPSQTPDQTSQMGRKGVVLEVALRVIRKRKQRIMAGVAIILKLILIWAELAVGIFGIPLAGS